jgi:16S rRNA U516 pseudouridylate synthase RsuA-like enzyme
MPEISIIKFLTASGAGSRRKMADAIKAGRVEANGQVVENFNLPIDPARDKITIDGKRVENTAREDIPAAPQTERHCYHHQRRQAQ